MRIDIIKIGNSRGVRLPKAILDQCQLTDQAELQVVEGEIRLRPVRRSRQGWAEAFAENATIEEEGDLLPAAIVNDFDFAEWEW